MVRHGNLDFVQPPLRPPLISDSLPVALQVFFCDFFRRDEFVMPFGTDPDAAICLLKLEQDDYPATHELCPNGPANKPGKFRRQTAKSCSI